MSASGKFGTARMCKGIVAFVDLSDVSRVDQAIEAHREAAGGRLRGIRVGGTWDQEEEIRRGLWRAPRHLYLDLAFREGVARLAAQGLSCAAWPYHPQLAELDNL